MLIYVNGKETELTGSTTLSGLIKLRLNLAAAEEAKGIAVALNGTVIPKHEWISTFIKNNDAVEIVHAVQGG